MKLKSLYIENYRVLQDLNLNFDRTARTENVQPQQGYTLDFLAGVNGSGKTTALQFLAKVFAWLYTADWCPVRFDLTYSLGSTDENTQRTVRVTNIPERIETEEDVVATSTPLSIMYKDGDKQWQNNRLDSTLLPDNLVLYTTGSEKEWAQAIDLDGDQDTDADSIATSGNEETKGELPGHRPNFDALDAEQEDQGQTNQLIFVRAQHLPLVALCGSIADHLYREKDKKDVLGKVLKAIGIEPLSAFTLRVRVHRDLTPRSQHNLIARLERAANRVIANGSDRILQFDMAQQPIEPSDPEAHPSIFSLCNSPIELFRQLFSLYEHRPYQDAPLQEISLFFKQSRPHQATDEDSADQDNQASHKHQNMLQLFEWLSDGESSFLARMALFTLFRADDLLILLDEPEVHFNDVWKREIVSTLDQILKGCASHAVITTHSSIALSDVRASDILVLRREGEHTSTTEERQTPGIETFGADPSDILIHVFNTPSATGEHSTNFIRREIGIRTVEELDALQKQVAPGYWQYRIQLERQRLQRTFQ